VGEGREFAMADEDIDTLKKRLDKCENEIVILTKTLKRPVAKVA
jgi:NifB/MoaA-like Fe-S oxidoreductase